MFIWKKKNPPRAELLLCLAAGDTNTETFFVKNTFQEAVKFVCGLFEPPCRTVGWPLEGGQGIVLLQNRLDEKKKDFHEVYFLFVKAQLRPKWETETENGFIISFYLSFIRFSDHDPSVRPLRAQQLFPEPGGLFLLTADNMLLTDCPLCSGLLLYILLLQSA